MKSFKWVKEKIAQRKARANEMEPKKPMSKARIILTCVLAAVIGFGMVPFSARTVKAWDPSLEPKLNGEYVLRPYIQNEDGTYRIGSTCVSVTDHGAGKNPIHLHNKNGKKVPLKFSYVETDSYSGHRFYYVYDVNSPCGLYNKFDFAGNTGDRLISCTDFIVGSNSTEEVMVEFLGQLSNDTYIIALKKGYTHYTDGTVKEKGSIGLTSPNSDTEKNDLRVKDPDDVQLWVLLPY